MTPLEMLLTALDADNKQLLLAIADACEEMGSTEEAKAWRWLAHEGKWPQAFWCGYLWVPSGSVRAYCTHASGILPDKVYQELPTLPEGGHVVYGYTTWPTRRAAFEAVVEALTKGPIT